MRPRGHTARPPGTLPRAPAAPTGARGYDRRPVRVLTWNMHHPFRVAQANDALNWLEALGADVMLLQEAPPPEDQSLYEGVKNAGRTPWGTLIRREKVGLKRVPLPHVSVPGGAVVAEIDSPGGPLTFISVYGVFERYLNTIWSIPNMHRIVSDLTPILADPKRKGRIVLGGDMNVDIAFDDDPKGVPGSHSLLLERLEAFGLKSVLPNRDPENRTPTWKRGKSGFQNDHLFVSRSLTHSPPQVVWDDQGFSDHAVLMADIDLPLAR